MLHILYIYIMYSERQLALQFCKVCGYNVSTHKGPILKCNYIIDNVSTIFYKKRAK
jgi:hypothetical protein